MTPLDRNVLVGLPTTAKPPPVVLGDEAPVAMRHLNEDRPYGSVTLVPADPSQIKVRHQTTPEVEHIGGHDAGKRKR